MKMTKIIFKEGSFKTWFLGFVNGISLILLIEIILYFA